jgi:glycosyltransferase involved in cell wall biosynthesis
MDIDIPCVSIGLAVFNGENFIKEAIDSILAQTYQDFELIISDNASTDKTEEICLDYASRDSRIRYHRNSTNIGGANNENRTFQLSKGKYFRWAAHDDICAPELVSKFVAVLDQDPSIVLCYSMIIEIDEKGNPIRTVSQKKGESQSPHERFRDLAKKDHNCEATYGLMRSSVLKATRLQQNYTDSDRTLLCELSLYGKFFEVQESLFYKRYHQKNMYTDMRARMAWFNPNLKGKPVFPYWMQFFDYIRSIKRTPITRKEKIWCNYYMFIWFLGHGKNLIGDILYWIYSKLSKYAYGWRNKHSDIYNWE